MVPGVSTDTEVKEGFTRGQSKRGRPKRAASVLGTKITPSWIVPVPQNAWSIKVISDSSEQAQSMPRLLFISWLFLPLHFCCPIITPCSVHSAQVTILLENRFLLPGCLPGAYHAPDPSSPLHDYYACILNKMCFVVTFLNC